jgi:hypothetical protein
MFSEAKICEGDFSGSQMKDDVTELEIAMHHISIVQILDDPGNNDICKSFFDFPTHHLLKYPICNPIKHSWDSELEAC